MPLRTLTGTGAPTTGVASGTATYWNGNTALATGDEVLVANGVAFDPNGVTLGAGRPAQPITRPSASNVAAAPSGSTALVTASYCFAYTVVDTNGLESIESVLSSSTFSATNAAAPPRWTFPAGFWTALHPGIASLNVYITDGTTNQPANLRLSLTGVTPGTSFVDFTAAYNAGNATPPNGAIRFTHNNAVLATGAVGGLPFLCRGDIVHAATSAMTAGNANSINGTGGSVADNRVSQIQAVGNDGRGVTFDYSTTVWGSEAPYGVYLSAGLRTGVPQGLALLGVQDGTLLKSAGTAPFITANNQGTWRQTSLLFSNTSTGRHRLKDAATTNCADQPLHKTTSQGSLTAPTGAPTVNVTGGGTTGGALAATAANAAPVTYTVAYAWQDASGNESALSPWSTYFSPASGNIPRVTCPDTVPAGVAYLLLYVRAVDTDPALCSFARYIATANGSPRTSVTVGSSNATVDLTQALKQVNNWPGPARTVRGLSVGYFSAGVESSITRTVVTRSGRVSTVDTSGASSSPILGNSDIQSDSWNEWLLGADTAWAFIGGTAPTTGAQLTQGSIHRNVYGVTGQNPNGATFGTTADPVYTNNYAPTITQTPQLAASRAFARYTRAPNGVFPGGMTRWYQYPDGTGETLTGAPNRQGGTLAKCLNNAHGFMWLPGLTAQSFDHNITDSAACGSGTGDWYAFSGSPTGASADWRAEFNIMLPDSIDQDRSVGDIQGSRAGSAVLQWAWNNNTLYRGPNGETQAFHVNETGSSAGMVDTMTKNLVWGPPGGGVPAVVQTRVLSDFGFGGACVAGTITTSDWNASWNVSASATVSIAGVGTTSTATAGTKGMNALASAFADPAFDQHSLVNVDPGFRAPWRNLITFYWAEKRAAGVTGFAVGATRNGATTVSDGTARNDTIQVQDVREALAFLTEHAVDPATGGTYARWFWRNYVAADGVTYTHVLDALEAHVKWGLAPTASAYNPTNTAGNAIGALAWVATGPGLAAGTLSVDTITATSAAATWGAASGGTTPYSSETVEYGAGASEGAVTSWTTLSVADTGTATPITGLAAGTAYVIRKVVHDAVSATAKTVSTFTTTTLPTTASGTVAASARRADNTTIAGRAVTYAVDRTDLVTMNPTTGAYTAVTPVAAPAAVTVTATSGGVSATTTFTVYPG